MSVGIRADKSGFVLIHRAADMIIPSVVLFILLRFAGIAWTDNYIVLAFLGGFLFVTFSQVVGVYHDWRGRRFFHNVKLILQAWLFSWSLLIIMAFFLKESDSLSRLATGVWSIFTPIVLIMYRLGIRLFLRTFSYRTRSARKIAIIGAGKVGRKLDEAFKSSLWLGYDVVGFYDDNVQPHCSRVDDTPVLGDIDQAYIDAKNGVFQELYICLPMSAEKKMRECLEKMGNTTVIVKYIPDIFSINTLYARWSDINGIPVISLFDSPLNSTTARLLKRVGDIVISGIILLLVSPIMVVLAIGVKLSSPGHVFYGQTRVSWNGSAFKMLKFRSMPVDVEKDGAKWGGAKDKTNSKFGQFIRSTSLDELPQFLNVLKGDMSIVGPRPERDIFVEKFREEIPYYMQKHMVKAGITGWAQIHGWRGDTCLKKRVEHDLYYINSWSFWLDIEIILLTIIKGFVNKNAQ